MTVESRINDWLHLTLIPYLFADCHGNCFSTFSCQKNSTVIFNLIGYINSISLQLKSLGFLLTLLYYHSQVLLQDLTSLEYSTVVQIRTTLKFWKLPLGTYTSLQRQQAVKITFHLLNHNNNNNNPNKWKALFIVEQYGFNNPNK